MVRTVFSSAFLFDKTQLEVMSGRIGSWLQIFTETGWFMPAPAKTLWETSTGLVNVELVIELAISHPVTCPGIERLDNTKRSVLLFLAFEFFAPRHGSMRCSLYILISSLKAADCISQKLSRRDLFKCWWESTSLLSVEYVVNWSAVRC